MDLIQNQNEIIDKTKIKKFINVILVITFISIALPLIIYFIKFNSLEFSRQKADWGTFGDFVGGVVGTLLNLIAAFFSLVSVYITLKIASRIQESENIFNQNNIIRETQRFEKEIEFIHKQHKPYIELELIKFHNKLDISIANYGLGPLILKKLWIQYKVSETYSNLFELIDKYTNSNTGTIHYEKASTMVIAQNSTKNLILIEPESRYDFQILRQKCLDCLRDAIIHIEYEDIFENKYSYESSLEYYCND